MPEADTETQEVFAELERLSKEVRRAGRALRKAQLAHQDFCETHWRTIAKENMRRAIVGETGEERS